MTKPSAAAESTGAEPVASSTMTVDIGAERIARVYAQAIIEAADRKGCRGEVLSELAAIVRDVLPAVPRARDVFASPRIGADKKARMIEAMTKGRTLPTTSHALHVLARHGRLGLLAEVVASAQRLAAELEGRKQATFTTAVPLAAAEQARIVTDVERALSATLAPTFAVDPDIIGGLVVRIGDTVYDQSIATALVRLGERLNQRSIHEIRYGRDRLSPA